MAQGIGISLEEDQKRKKLAKKGLGMPTQMVNVGGKLVPIQSRRGTAMMPAPLSGDLAGETAVSHGPGVLDVPMEKAMPDDMAFSKTAHHAAGPGVPAPEQTMAAAVPATQPEAEPGAGAAVAGTETDGSGIYAPEYPEAAGVAPAPGAGVPAPAAVKEKGGLNKAAMNKALLVAGLTMLDKGGRASATPISATSVIGQGGLAGVQTYDQDVAEQQRLEKGDVALEAAKYEISNQPMKSEALNLAIQKERIALEGAKIDQGHKAKLAAILDALATETDPKKFADLQTRYSAMAGNIAGKTTSKQQVKEKVKVGVNELGEDVYAEKTVGSFDTGTGGMSRYEQAGGKGLPGQKLDETTAQAFLKQAGGDREKARQLAAQAGYTF